MAIPVEKAVRKYLEAHAEPEAHAGSSVADSRASYGAVICIPAYGEGESLFDTLASIPTCSHGRVLAVVVINEPADASRQALETNRAALERLRKHTLEAIDDRCAIGPFGEHDLALIDRTASFALPPKRGVGLARKIVADFALGLQAHGGVASPVIHCTDADALLPPDYFERPREPAVAWTYDFRHEGGPAILEYEIYLRYAVLGLRAAGSRWAWHAIGSTLAIDASAYARVRGFPRREAAEDFHLLAKLSKLGRIAPLRGEPIRLDDRVSDRVPFGTGRAMKRAEERGPGGDPLRVPDPRVYAYLETWQRALDALVRGEPSSVGDAIAEAAGGRDVDATLLRAALDSLGAIEAYEKALSKQSDPTRYLEQDFDALATLRLLHALRDRVHPEVELERAIARAPFLDEEVREAWGDLEAVREALVRQEHHCLR